MILLREIFRNENARKDGRTVQRAAARGIILNGRKLLMVYSPVNGDYKFPGGGVDEGESHDQTLRREVREECGATVKRVGDCVAEIVEYDVPAESDYDVFKMTSRYYLCEIEGGIGEQELDDYERDLQFNPVWVNVDEAIRVNQLVLNANDKEAPKWTRRDTLMLEYVRKNLLTAKMSISAPLGN